MEHRGEILEKAIRESGISITKLAERIKKSRQHIYNLFHQSYINPDVMMEIGKIINHDFTKDLNLYHLAEEPSEKYQSLKEEVKHWKDKYIELLEKYNELLEKSDH